MPTNQFVLVEKAAYTASFATADIDGYDSKGAMFVIDIDTVTGTDPTLDVKLQRKDEFGNYLDVEGAVFAQKDSAGQDDLVIFPGAVAVTNRVVNNTPGRTYRLYCTIGGTDTPTFTFGITATKL
jgi:hypothetical protein